MKKITPLTQFEVFDLYEAIDNRKISCVGYQHPELCFFRDLDEKIKREAKRQRFVSLCELYETVRHHWKKLVDQNKKKNLLLKEVEKRSWLIDLVPFNKEKEYLIVIGEKDAIEELVDLANDYLFEKDLEMDRRCKSKECLKALAKLHKKTGEYCGYPKCCIEAFIKNSVYKKQNKLEDSIVRDLREKYGKIVMENFKKAFEETKKLETAIARVVTNFLAGTAEFKWYQFFTICFYPCKVNCKNAEKLSKKAEGFFIKNNLADALIRFRVVRFFWILYLLGLIPNWKILIESINITAEKLEKSFRKL